MAASCAPMLRPPRLSAAALQYSRICRSAVSARTVAALSAVDRARLLQNARASAFATSAPIPGDHMKEGLGLPASAKALAIKKPFKFEHGDVLPELILAYSTYGKLNADGSNAVIVGHSLTSNSAVHEWWGPLIGEGPQYTLDTSKYFVVCCNYLGSVYGSSGPLDIDPRTNKRFGSAFPIVTLQDNVRAQRLLLDALGVRRLALAMGGSLGGMLAMEWAATYPEFVDQLLVVACCAAHTDWAIGWGEAGRQAIYADPKWREGDYPLEDPPLAGMNVARQAAMLSYRTPFSFTDRFRRSTHAQGRSQQQMAHQGQGAARAAGAGGLAPAPFFEIESYLNHQGDKFIRRFDPLAYVRLTQLLDSHDIGRNRGGDYRATLARMKVRSLVVGIDSDLLYPLELQKEMASLIPDSSLLVILTPHGHDGFLIEIDALNTACAAWVQTEKGKEVAYPGIVKGSSVKIEKPAQDDSAGKARMSKHKIKLG